LLVFGQAGNDNLQVAGGVTNAAWLYGGDGDDRLKGGAGVNVLFGGDGDDLLIGGRGRNLLVGGRGADHVVGNAGSDILIGGITTFGPSDAALLAALQDWNSADDFDTRVARLRSFFDAAVHDDGTADVLTGSAGQDWFFAGLGDG